jgi:ABC-type uncharacterized transport system substrate-binding protein
MEEPSQPVPRYWDKRLPKNVIIEYRWARGRYDRLREMAADLVRRRVAVIVTTGASPSLLAARGATREIPTVLISGEPMQDSIVVSFNRPGRNATGVSLSLQELGWADGRNIRFLD